MPAFLTFGDGGEALFRQDEVVAVVEHLRVRRLADATTPAAVARPISARHVKPPPERSRVGEVAMTSD
jgi:hypothetical protein